MDYDISKEYCRIIQNKINLNDFDTALDNAKKLVSYCPDSAEGYYYVGLCCFALGNFNDSINNYEKCIELDHNFAKAYYNLGVTRYYLNDHKEALNYVEYAYKLFKKANNKEACAKCLESIEYIKEEHGL